MRRRFGSFVPATDFQPAMPTPSSRRVRVLIAKLGLDGHDVGARVVARGLAAAGRPPDGG